MTSTAFVIDLGNGIFLDSSGGLTSNIPSGVATFSLSHAVPVPSAAIQDVFGGTGSVLPKLEKIGGVVKQIKDVDLFKQLGASEDFTKTFGAVAEIASTLASVIPFVSIGVALVSVFASFGGSDPIKDLIEREFTRLFERLDQADRDAISNYIGTSSGAFVSALSLVDDYRHVLAKPPAYRVPGELERKRNALDAVLPHLQEVLTGALRHEWKLPLDPVAYWDNWGSMRQFLFTVPRSSVPVPASAPASPTFDHRPMVQLLAFGIQAYLTSIKATVPEYRTTGKHSLALRTMAADLSKQLDKMREQTLARTIYKAGVAMFPPGSRQFYVLGVGAMDLRADTDENLLYAAFEGRTDHPEWDGAANLYRMWTSAPAVDIRGPNVTVAPGLDWPSINPAAVDLANAQADRAYAALLMRSGFFTLAHLEALLRHLSTEPDTSETVTGSVEIWRRALAASPAPVTTEPIPFSSPTTVTGSREPQECKAYLSLTTQPVRADEGIGYRVRLVTLPNGTSEMPFDMYAWNTYVTDGATRDWKLRVNVNAGLTLDPVGANERQLADSRSPDTPLHVPPHSVHLTADTFDWYVEHPANPILTERIQDGIRIGITPPPGFGGGVPKPPPGGGGTVINQSAIGVFASAAVAGESGFGLQPGEPTLDGEKRDWARKSIALTCELYWHEDRLTIALTARPEDRNYTVYLVVEERLSSAQWLRTAIPVRFTGQITYVPRSFFEAEEKARTHANELLGRIERNYSISRQPGPADPVLGRLRPGGFRSASDMQDFVDAVQQHAPEIIDQTLLQSARATSV